MRRLLHRVGGTGIAATGRSASGRWQKRVRRSSRWLQIGRGVITGFTKIKVGAEITSADTPFARQRSNMLSRDQLLVPQPPMNSRLRDAELPSRLCLATDVIDSLCQSGDRNCVHLLWRMRHRDSASILLRIVDLYEIVDVTAIRNRIAIP